MSHKHLDEYLPHDCDGKGHQHHHHSDGSCCCGGHAEEYHGIDKPLLARLIAAAVLYLCGMVLPVGETAEAILMIAAALVAGYDIIFAAVKNIIKLRFFDEYFLMAFAAIAACIIGEYEEGAAVFLLYRVGAFCQSYAVRRSRKTISTLTGECMNHVDEEDKLSDAFITRFARVYTPVILIFAVLIAVWLPFLTDTTLKDSIYRALTFLVLACPCAIVISVPLAYFAGIGAANRKGLFFRDSGALDVVAKAQPEKKALKNVSIKYKSAYVYTLSDEPDVKTAELVLTEEGEGLDEAIRIAKKTRRIVHENVWFTIAVKLAVLVLAVCGISRLWFAVFADSGVTILVVLNSLRAFLNTKKKA